MVGPETAFSSVDNVHKAVVGVYGKASLRSKLGVVEYIADDCVQGSDAGGAGSDLATWVYSATSGDASSIWSHYYGIINQANRVLYYGPKVETTTEEDEASLNTSLGTAYFFRAYAHFELLCLFSDFTDPEAAGIPYVSHYHVTGNPAREPVEDCYEQIMTDLGRAVELIEMDSPSLTASISADNSVGYVSKSAVNALRARVSLYRGDYVPAYIYAASVLNETNITPIEDVNNMWLDKSNEGVIFKLSRPAGSSTIGSLFVGGDYSSVFRPSNDLRALYSEEDIRTDIFMQYGRDRAGSGAWMVGKWFGEASDIGRVDEKMFRSEEMLLIAAEALVKRDAADAVAATALLNELKAERYEDYSNQTFSDVMSEVIAERRLELAWEGHRLFDARRLGVDLKREGKSIAHDDPRLILPIPQAEIDANSNINDSDQNYGY